MSEAAGRTGAAPVAAPGRTSLAATVDAGVPATEPRTYVGLVTRAIAFAVDAALIDGIAIVVAAAVAVAVSVLSEPASLDAVFVALGGVLFVIWSTAYFVAFWSATGQTPGCRLMRIRVCSASDGTPLPPARALLRLVFLTLAALPLFAGFLPILFDSRRRGLHDMLAGSVVVDAPPTRPGAVSRRARGASPRGRAEGAAPGP